MQPKVSIFRCSDEVKSMVSRAIQSADLLKRPYMHELVSRLFHLSWKIELASLLTASVMEFIVFISASCTKQ